MMDKNIMKILESKKKNTLFKKQEELNMNTLIKEVEEIVESFNEEKFKELTKVSEGTYNFNKIMAQLVEEQPEDELEAFRLYLNIMNDRGFVFDRKSRFFAMVRGDLEYTKNRRISTYRKNFFVSQIKEALREVHQYIRKLPRY